MQWSHSISKSAVPKQQLTGSLKIMPSHTHTHTLLLPFTFSSSSSHMHGTMDPLKPLPFKSRHYSPLNSWCLSPLTENHACEIYRYFSGWFMERIIWKSTCRYSTVPWDIQTYQHTSLMTKYITVTETSSCLGAAEASGGPTADVHHTLICFPVRNRMKDRQPVWFCRKFKGLHWREYPERAVRTSWRLWCHRAQPRPQLNN